MNHIVQYVLLFGLTGAFFTAMYQAGADDLSRRSAELDADSIRLGEQLGEHVRLIDFVSGTPYPVVDVMNTGKSTINISHVLVDGHIDTDYEIRLVRNNTVVWNNTMAAGGHIPGDEIVRITADRHGDVLALITQNDKMFKFGE